MGIHLGLSEELSGTITGFLLVLARISAFVAIGPIFSARFLPQRIRVAIALVISFVAWVGAGSPTVDHWSFTDVARESGLGLLLGIGARATLEAALALGAIFSGQIGFSFASTIDPTAGHQSDVVSDLISFMTLSMAVALGLHREAIVLLCHSVTALPPGSSFDLMSMTSVVIEQVAGTCALAVRLAFPLMTMTSAGYIAMGFIGKGAPVLGIQGLGFTVPVIAGGFTLYALAPTAAELIARSSVQALHSFG